MSDLVVIPTWSEALCQAADCTQRMRVMFDYSSLDRTVALTMKCTDRRRCPGMVLLGGPLPEGTTQAEPQL